MHPGSTPVGPWPSVSVVIPTRDRPEQLRRAVRRVLDQDYPGEIECLVVFDQSDPAEVPVEQAPRRRTAVVACGIQVHYGNRVIERLPPPGPVPLQRFLRSRVMEIHPSTILVRLQALLGPIGLVDEELPGSYGEDYEWLLRAARVAPVAVVPRALVRVHWHPASFFTGRWQTIADAITYLIDKHPELQGDPAGIARLEGQLAFAHAALGQRGVARSWAARAVRHNWRERRGYVALAVSARLLRAETVMRLANSLGRGV